MIRELPFMSTLKRINISTSNIIQPVLSFMVSKDRRFLLVGCGEGGLTVITEPLIQQQASAQANQRQARASVAHQKRGLNTSSGKLSETQSSAAQQQNPYTNAMSSFTGNSKLSKTSGGSKKTQSKAPVQQSFHLPSTLTTSGKNQESSYQQDMLSQYSMNQDASSVGNRSLSIDGSASQQSRQSEKRSLNMNKILKNYPVQREAKVATVSGKPGNPSGILIDRFNNVQIQKQ